MYELKAQDKVKLKQLESLAKEAGNADIQEDPLCKEEADQLQRQVALCRQWAEEQVKADLNSNKDIIRLLELGKATLRYNLGDFVDLRNFHQDMIEWRETTLKILNGPKTSQYNYEFLRKHIEMGRTLDIADQELELLVALVDVCAHWKSVARKILASRQLAILDIGGAP